MLSLRQVALPTAILGAGLGLSFAVYRGISLEAAPWVAPAIGLLSICLASLSFWLQLTSHTATVQLELREKEVEEVQALLASIVESSADSIIGTTLDGSIISWNRGSEVLWGYTAEEAIGQHITMLFKPELRAGYTRSIGRVKSGEGIAPFDTIRVRKDGSLVHVNVIVSPIRNTAGELIGASGIYRDITELLKAKEQAEAANKAKSEFLANMSHEIRTPMNGILGMTELVLDSPLRADQRECLTLAKSSADALLSLINDILDFSKIEAGMMTVEQTEFPVHRLVNDTIATLILGARKKGLTLTAEFGENVPDRAIGDPHRIRQLLLNLVGNALKFTHEGSVTVRTRMGPKGVTFSVADTGIGIEPSKLGSIFEAFTQADNSTTRRYGGTGLGLTICRRLAELMGGEIWAESAVGKGSVFSFCIPQPAAELVAEPDTEAVAKLGDALEKENRAPMFTWS